MPLLFLTFFTFFFLSTPAWAEHPGVEIAEQDGGCYSPFHKEPLNGSVGTWYSKGQLKSEVTYKEGKQDGLTTVWYENGQKKTEGTMKEGNRDGQWEKWDEQGNITKQGTYKDGEEVQ